LSVVHRIAYRQVINPVKLGRLTAYDRPTPAFSAAHPRMSRPHFCNPVTPAPISNGWGFFWSSTVPTRFRMQAARHWAKPDNARCVAGLSVFRNPFWLPVRRLRNRETYAIAAARFRHWITSPEQAKLLVRAKRELRGFDLGCYCPLDMPCHADVLLELMNQD
jgi:Domain of unknown function (DUF4326)